MLQVLLFSEMNDWCMTFFLVFYLLFLIQFSYTLSQFTSFLYLAKGSNSTIVSGDSSGIDMDLTPISNENRHGINGGDRGKEIDDLKK